MNRQLIQIIADIQTGRAPLAVMVVVVATSDSTPQSPGARMLVMADGTTHGTVGGGAIEKLAIDRAGEMLVRSQSTDFQRYDMDAESNTGDKATGMMCGGTMSLYFERIAPEERFIVYGCGHIGGILVPLAAQCGFQVIAVDHRTEMTAPDRFTTPVDIQCVLPPDHAAELETHSGDTIVIMTHNHQFDAAVLENLLKTMTPETMPRYIGMIGSGKKVKVILDKLEENGIDQKLLNRVHTPIGLKIGGGSPGEIAVSVMAEVLAAKYGQIENGRVATMRSKHYGRLE